MLSFHIQARSICDGSFCLGQGIIWLLQWQVKIFAGRDIWNNYSCSTSLILLPVGHPVFPSVRSILTGRYGGTQHVMDRRSRYGILIQNSRIVGSSSCLVYQLPPQIINHQPSVSRKRTVLIFLQVIFSPRSHKYIKPTDSTYIIDLS